MEATLVAKRLRTLAENDRQRNGILSDAEAIELGAAAIDATHAAYAREFARAERLARELVTLRTRIAELQAENTQLRSDCRALEAVSGQSRPSATEQVVETDQRGNIKRVTTRPLRAEKRSIGFV
jgi:predicted  nucleic acid-binding Zn-ribbon protein